MELVIIGEVIHVLWFDAVIMKPAFPFKCSADGQIGFLPTAALLAFAPTIVLLVAVGGAVRGSIQSFGFILLYMRVMRLLGTLHWSAQELAQFTL
jgi:hypothetical protein